MVVTTSDNGITFRDMRVVHGELPPPRYAGKAKDTGPQYLRGVAEWAGDATEFDKTAIWVVYSVSKEDIWISRIPVPILAEAKDPVHDDFEAMALGPRIADWNVYAPLWAPVRIAGDSAKHNRYLELEDRDPVDYARAARTFPRSVAGDISFRLSAAQSDHGRLEIDLLGEKGTRPVQLSLDEHGRIQARDGERSADLGTYKTDDWTEITIKVKDNHFTVMRDGKELLKEAAFTESSSFIYALSFRTGEYRAVGAAKMPKQDLANSEEPSPQTIYRIDNVTTSHLKRSP